MASSSPVWDSHHPSWRVWRFADCELDELGRELRVRGIPVELEAKPFEVLRQLLLRPGEVVTKEELFESVWPGLVVVDASLTTAVSKIRKALSDEDARVVLTVPRVGYRLGVPIEVKGTASAGEPAKGAVATEIKDRTRRPRRVWIAVLCSIVVLSVSVTLYKKLSSSAFRPLTPFRITSLAVLPLTNMSGDPAQDYLADGITEELITELSKIQALKVISRTSVMQYKGAKKPLPVIARELQVDGIVEGAVLRSGSRVRVTAQLIEAKTDAHLFAQSYDRDLADILSLQRELALQISREINVTILPSEAKQLAHSGRVNPQAHEIYLRGRYFWNQRTPDSLYRAAEYFSEASQVDPSDPRPYAGLADTYIELVAFGDIEPSEGISKARAAAQRAIQLDDSLAEAHTALGYTDALDWDWAGSQKEFQRALELNPGYIVALYQYGFVLSMWGRQDEAIALSQKAAELDPLSPIVLYRAGRVQFHARHYDVAAKLYRRILEFKPDDQLALYGLGMLYEAQGKFAKAISSLGEPYRQSGLDLVAAYAAAGNKKEARRRLAAEMRRLQAEKSYIRPGYLAEVYTNLGERDEALRWLEKGYSEHDAWLALLKVWPRFDPLRADPRFRDLLRRMNFPP